LLEQSFRICVFAFGMIYDLFFSLLFHFFSESDVDCA